MGAIAGVLPRRRSFNRDDLTATLAGASDAMRRRAPIEGGMVVAPDGSIGLAHRAGCGPGGESVLQPLTNETGRLWLVADGEPSNAAELRLELVGAGHRFRSESGSEVILHLYEQDGVGALQRLDGAFAFAIWDPEHRELLIGRDRFGEKPLYVADGPERLSFASEVHALDGDAALARTALAFLTLGFIPEPLSAAAAASAVEPGSILRVRGERAWSEGLWEGDWLRPGGERDADRARLGCLVRGAVQAAVRGEEDIGILLDGGIGSAALLALARPMLGRGLRTHAFILDTGAPRSAWRNGVSGSAAARATERAIATWFQSDHREHLIGPADTAAALLAAAAADQPSISMGFAQVAAARMRASGDRVALSALGPAELFGLPRDAAPPWLWQAACHGASRALLRAAAHVVARFNPFGRSATVAGYLSHPGSIASTYLATCGLFAPEALGRLLRAEALEQARAELDPIAYLDDLAIRAPGPSRPVPTRSARAAAGRMLAGLDRVGRLISGRLRDAEGAAAAQGLALRAPYLDHRLFEWVTAAGAENEAAGSPLLAYVLGTVLPPQIWRGLRQAPAAPVGRPLGRWMRNELRPLIEASLFADDPEGLFATTGIAALWRGFLSGQVGWSPVWALAVLRAWVAARREKPRARSLARGLPQPRLNAA